jgi:hypothetical protein
MKTHETQDERINTAVYDATEAFWEVISAHYEEIITGDLDPVTTCNLNQTLTAAVKIWLEGNTP